MIHQILELLTNVKKTPNGYSAQCPSHDDRKNSLDIAQAKDGKILMNCKVGCKTSDICKELGIQLKDLFPKKEYVKPKVIAKYNYTDEQGNLLFQKLRYEPKDFRCVDPNGNFSIEGIRRPLYNLPNVIKADTVFVVEGEKDCHALMDRGYVATCNYDGACKWSEKYNEFLQGKTVYIIPDNDSAGRKHAALVLENIPEAKIITLPNGCKDTYDYFAAGNTSEQFDQLRIRKPSRYMLPDEQPDTIAKAFKNQSDVVHKYNRYDGWSIYHKGQYQRVDDPKEIRLHIRKFLSNCYVTKIIKGEEVSVRLNRQSTGFISDCLEALASLDDVHILPSKKAPYSFDGAVNPEYTIATKNMLIDISERPYKTQPVSQNFYTFNYLDYNYDPEAYSDKWADFLLDITKSDLDIMLLLQQWCGYLLLPTLKHQKFMLCVGDGANGKGVFFDTIAAALGKHNVSNIPLSRFDSPYALFGTYGKAVNMSNENAKNLEENAESIIKEYTAGDKICWEQKYKDTFFDYPTAKLMFSTNETPRIKDASDGIWRRIIMVPFDAKFPENARNINLGRELQTPKELSGILNWMLEGAEILEKNGGFVQPDRCKEALEQYRLESDSVRLFLTENVQTSAEKDSEIPCNGLYNAYKKWCENEGLKPKNNINFGHSFHKIHQGQKDRIRTTSGRKYVYRGVEVHPDSEFYDIIMEYK